MKTLSCMLILILLTALSSCSGGDYCIRCIDTTFLGPPIEGCSDDLQELESTRDEWEAIGYTCVIFQPL